MPVAEERVIAEPSPQKSPSGSDHIELTTPGLQQHPLTPARHMS